ncbi:MAG: very short patch repair endonuclease [Dehalococcoidia bacterium]|nr:very short patch repair endonuclease [Dehalococcoidia bacterium]
MRGNRSSDTRPERRLRSELHRRGHRFRKSYRISFKGGSARADIVFPGHRLAVFVDGCFWHQCPWHGNVPRANSSYWAPKLARNVERDKRVKSALEDEGWRVLRIWEHVQPPDAADQVAQALATEKG